MGLQHTSSRGSARSFDSTTSKSWRHGMTAGADPFIREVRVTKDEIVACLADGRVISVPLAWSWRLSDATPAERANWRLIGDDHGSIGPTSMKISAPKAC